MSDPTNKAELLANMDTGHRSFEALLAPLSEEQLSTPGVNADWSIKDILVHLTVWQRRVIDRLEAILTGNDNYQPDRQVVTDEQTNQFNDETFLDNRDRPVSEVLSAFRATYAQLHADVEALDEATLFDTQRFPWLDGAPLWQNVEGNTFGHYDEHMPVIEAWLEA